MGSPELKNRFFTKLMSIYVGYVGLSQCSTEEKITRSIFAKFSTNIWTRNYVIKVALGLQRGRKFVPVSGKVYLFYFDDGKIKL